MPSLSDYSCWRRRFAWALLVFISHLGGLRATAADTGWPNYFLRSWKTDSGLPDNAVSAILQTRDGYLWVGTYAGLARFDGMRFVTFNSAQEPGLQSDRITSLSEDADGTIWVGQEGGDLTLYRNGHFEPQKVHGSGMRRKISATRIDDAGDGWMLNEEGTLVRVRDGFTCALPNANGVVQMARAEDGELWIASGGRLAVLSHGRLQTNDPAIFGSYVQGICRSGDGGMWVLSDRQLKKWKHGIVTEDRGANPCTVVVTAMLETPSGCLAMGTSSDGLYLQFTNHSYLHLNQETGFPNDWVRCLECDREGTLWAGVGSVGIIAVRPGTVQTLSAEGSWHGRAILSTAIGRDGAIWIGTEGAGLFRYQDNQWKAFNESNGLANPYIWSVSQDNRGRMWAATWGGGIFVLEDNHFVSPPGMETITVPMAATLQARDGTTWIGTVNGLIQYKDGRVKWYGEKDGLKSVDVRALVEAPDGTIWFGMLGGGLGRVRDGTAIQFQKSSGLSSDYVQSLALQSDGTLWIGTYGSGLDRLKDGRFSKITGAEGLPNNFICAFEEDGRNNYWISSHNGIFRVSIKDLNDCADHKINHINCLRLGTGDGLLSGECSGGLQPAACKMADGNICFPTSKGLAIVDVHDETINRRPPPVVIEDISAAGHVLAQSLSLAGPLKIQPGLQRFEFRFSGLSFIAPEKMQFQYRLENWDPDWLNAASDKRVAEYSFIPPGTYTFRVRACNSDGVWNNEGASATIIVLPHLWQTWWFYLLEALVSITIIANVVWYISRRRMRRKLEAAQRQQAIERERARIAKDIHDHLGANLTRISLLSQSAHGELENPARAATQLERIYETSRELTRALDEIVWAVNPQHDTLDSLASYLGNFAQEYLGSIGLRCRLDVPLQLPHWPITAEMRHNVFLAFKEALHNIVKHSGASEVLVSLVTDHQGFQLLARDNGKGFDPAAVTPRPGRGNGLKNMQQRLEKLGGRCDIHSTVGAGSEVRFSVPVSVSNES